MAPTPGTPKTVIVDDNLITLDKPDSLADGDVLRVAIHARDTKGIIVANLPSGWTLVDEDADNGGAGIDLSILKKEITDAASEPASYTFETNDAGLGSAAIQAISGADPTIDAISSIAVGAGTSQTAPSVDPTTADGLLDCIVGQRAVSSNAFTPPGTMTEHWDIGDGFGGGTGATEALSSGDPTGTRGFTSDTDNDWWAISIVWAPAAAGGATLTAEQGSYSLTGQTSDLLRGLLLDAAQGSYSVTGQDATLARGVRLIAEQGGYDLTGEDATLLWARVLDAAQGTYSLGGQDASLSRGFTLVAEQGNYTLSGQAADLLRGLLLAAEQGDYTLSGKDAALLRALLLSAEQGAYTLTGNAAALTRGLRLAAAQGGYTLSGQGAELLRGLLLAAEQGGYVVTGNAAALSKSGETILLAEQGAYVVDGQDATLIAPSDGESVLEGPFLVNPGRLMRTR